MTDRPVILYDADCGFCKWSLKRVLAWDRDGKLRPVALQSPEAVALLPGMDPERRMESWHLVAPDGRIWSGGAAVEPLVAIVGRGRPIGALARRFPRATNAVYRWVADHRSFFGRFLHG